MKEEEAHSGDVVDGMEMIQHEVVWNENVHSSDSQILAWKKKKNNQKQIKNKNHQNGTIFSVYSSDATA